MEEVPQPHVRPRDVLVKVLASTINIDDIHVSEGTFYGGIPIGPRPRPDRPVIPGSDLAGIVVGVGRHVRSVQTGDAVFGLQTPFRASGSWAEFCAVDERWIARKPEQISFETAAASAVSGLVALSAIKALGLCAGMRIVVVGASGGIGAIAVQLASRSGAEVIGVCGPKTAERARSLGCSLVLDYNHGPWDQTLRAQGRTPVDRVLDAVGGRDTEQMGRSALRRDGIFVTVVGPERFIGDRALGWSRILGIFAHIGYRTLSSFVRGPRYILTGPGLGGGKALTEVAAALSAGMLPPVDSTVPFELPPMQEALRRAAAHQNQGRIAIQVSK
jgi:NADPH:quinone reductase-like Zn-dependent oxidoreductase